MRDLQPAQAHAAEPHDQEGFLVLVDLDLLERAVGGDAGARIGRGKRRVDAGDIDEMFRMRHHAFFGVTAGTEDTERGRLRAIVLLVAQADVACAAAEPRIDQKRLADLAVGDRCIGALRDEPAENLVSHDHRRGHAAIGETQALAAAEIVVAVLNMQIAVADAAARDIDHHFRAGGLRIGLFDRRDRLAEHLDGIGAHCSVPPAGGLTVHHPATEADGIARIRRLHAGGQFLKVSSATRRKSSRPAPPIA